MIRKIIHRIKWVIAALLLWCVYLFTSILNFPSSTFSNNADVAIVLGAAVFGSEPSPVFAERINHAVELYHQNKVAKLIFTGASGHDDELAESIVARDYAINHRVKPEDIFIETQSVTTQQNLFFANEILIREKLNTALIVSDALHLKRAILMAKNLGINAKPSGTPTSRYQSLKKKAPFALRELYFYHHYLLFSE